jgi:inorganic pyrophosphatase
MTIFREQKQVFVWYREIKKKKWTESESLKEELLKRKGLKDLLHVLVIAD